MTTASNANAATPSAGTTANGTSAARHTISVFVHDRPGVLSRVAQVFARRGFNIDSLVVSPAHLPGFSRMTIGCQGDPAVLDQIIKQVDKLVDTVRAIEHEPEESVERELALVKVQVSAKQRMELFQLVEVFRAKTVDVDADSVIIEVTGSSEKLDAFIDLLGPFDLMELIRSGKLAIARGREQT